MTIYLLNHIFVKSDMKTQPANTVDQMFRAVADQTRLRILHLLLGGELCVCDIVSALDMAQPKVSRHLALLREADLVTARKDGLWIHYKLTKPTDAFHRKLLECLKCCFEGVPELAEDAKRLKRSRCC